MQIAQLKDKSALSSQAVREGEDTLQKVQSIIDADRRTLKCAPDPLIAAPQAC